MKGILDENEISAKCLLKNLKIYEKMIESNKAYIFNYAGSRGSSISEITMKAEITALKMGLAEIEDITSLDDINIPMSFR